MGELIHRVPAVVFDDNTLREAADHMVRERVGRLPVVSRAAPERVTGILTRSDLLAAHERRLDETHRRKRGIRVRRLLLSQAREVFGVRR